MVGKKFSSQTVNNGLNGVQYVQIRKTVSNKGSKLQLVSQECFGEVEALTKPYFWLQQWKNQAFKSI
jgi:hypothetical protein